MPIPTFHFDDETRGLPRQPVPVRFACIATGWSPNTIASLASGKTTGYGGPLIDIHAFNDITKKAGDVAPSIYAAILKSLSGNLSDDLQKLPANHFVWSDNLAYAFTTLINEADDTDEIRQYGIKIYWNPELGGNTSVIDECPDLSPLVKDESSQNVISFNNDIWSISYNGQQVNIPDQKGIHYIKILLLHPQVEYSIQDLYIEVNPPPPTSHINLEEFISADEDGANSGFSIGGLGDAGEYLDDQTKQQYKDRLAAIEHKREIAIESGNSDKSIELEEEAMMLKKQLSAAFGLRGQPRIIGNVDEKIRKSIRNATARAIEHITKYHAALGQHLKNAIITGYSCSYRPTAGTSWQG